MLSGCQACVHQFCRGRAWMFHRLSFLHQSRVLLLVSDDPFQTQVARECIHFLKAARHPTVYSLQ